MRKVRNNWYFYLNKETTVWKFIADNKIIIAPLGTPVTIEEINGSKSILDASSVSVLFLVAS